MKSPSKSPKSGAKADKVTSMLRDFIREGRWEKAGRLPTVRALAALCRTSLVTMVEALKRLCDEGLLLTLEGRKGYFLPGSEPAEAPGFPERGLDSHARIAEKIKEEVFSGLYRPEEPLPSLKYFQKAFSCTHATARAALQTLERAGLLKAKGKTWVRKFPAAPSFSRSRIHLAARPESIRHFKGNLFNTVQTLEFEVQKLGWGQLEFFLSESPRDDAKAPPDHQVAAFIHFADHFSRDWYGFFQARPHLPLILLDYPERLDWRFPGHRSFHWIRADNRLAGREVGILLASLGHRKVAYFTEGRMDTPWRQKRHAGLREGFVRASSLREGPVREVLLFGGDAESLDRSRASQHLHHTRLGGAFQTLLEDEKLSRTLIHHGMHGVFELAHAGAIGEGLWPCFEKALGVEGLTAWVCANDDVAALAKAFLDQHRVQVPREISLVALDNSPITYLLGITSWDFGSARMGQMAIRCLSHGESLERARDGAVILPGQLLLRHTTGPASY